MMSIPFPIDKCASRLLRSLNNRLTSSYNTRESLSFVNILLSSFDSSEGLGVKRALLLQTSKQLDYPTP